MPCAIAPAGAAAFGASGFAAGSAASAFPTPFSIAARTSRSMMRPCGPDPFTAFRSRPASLAMRRASGEAKMRSPEPVLGTGGALEGAGAASDMAGGSRGVLFRFRLGLGFGSLVIRSLVLRLGRRTAAIGGHFDLGRILTLLRDQRDEVVDRDIGRPFWHNDFGQRSFIDRLDLHGRLVGLDLGENVAGFDAVAFA